MEKDRYIPKELKKKRWKDAVRGIVDDLSKNYRLAINKREYMHGEDAHTKYNYSCETINPA